MNQVREIGERAGVPTSEASDGAREALEGLPASATAEAAEVQVESERSQIHARILLNVVLFVSLAAEIFVLYVLTEPGVRVGLGVLPLIPIMWASSRLGIVDRFSRALYERKRTRRYVRLRARVDQLLEEIKRMNWVVVDMERGLCTEEAARGELEASRSRLRKLVDGLPEVAGLQGLSATQ